MKCGIGIKFTQCAICNKNICPTFNWTYTNKKYKKYEEKVKYFCCYSHYRQDQLANEKREKKNVGVAKMKRRYTK